MTTRAASNQVLTAPSPSIKRITRCVPCFSYSACISPWSRAGCACAASRPSQASSKRLSQNQSRRFSAAASSSSLSSATCATPNLTRRPTQRLQHPGSCMRLPLSQSRASSLPLPPQSPSKKSTLFVSASAHRVSPLFSTLPEVSR